MFLFRWLYICYWRFICWILGETVEPWDTDIQTNGEILMSIVGKINGINTKLIVLQDAVAALGTPAPAPVDPTVAAKLDELTANLAALTKTVDDLVAGVDPDAVVAPTPAEPVVETATAESEGTLVVGEPQ